MEVGGEVGCEDGVVHAGFSSQRLWLSTIERYLEDLSMRRRVASGGKVNLAGTFIEIQHGIDPPFAGSQGTHERPGRRIEIEVSKAGRFRRPEERTAGRVTS